VAPEGHVSELMHMAPMPTFTTATVIIAVA
jgi:hypothetical protein